jgi:type IV secretion system protein VirD4
MGIPKRSMVEQIRERDLMMPQEVRQMPADRLIILAEGQPTIAAHKLKYYTTVLFRSAVRDGAENSLVVPNVDMFPAAPFPVRPPNHQEDRDET